MLYFFPLWVWLGKVSVGIPSFPLADKHSLEKKVNLQPRFRYRMKPHFLLHIRTPSSNLTSGNTHEKFCLTNLQPNQEFIA